MGEAARALYYSDVDNPIGSRRSLREFCRRCGVRTFRAGPRLLVMREELDAAIQGRRPDLHSVPAGDDAALLRAGVLRVGGAR